MVSHAHELLRHLPEQRVSPPRLPQTPTIHEIVRESEYVMSLQSEIGRLNAELHAKDTAIESHVATIQVLRAELTDAQAKAVRR